MTLLRGLFAEEDGQDMIEYGLVISLVVIGGIASYQAFQNQIGAALNTLGAAITNAL
jgi:Flp pilus assembly pilin Flp